MPKALAVRGAGADPFRSALGSTRDLVEQVVASHEVKTMFFRIRY